MTVQPAGTVRAITLDAVGTLFRVRGSVGERYAESAQAVGLDLEPAALQQAFREAWHAAPIPEAKRGPRGDDDRGWWQALVFRVLEITGCGASSTQAAAFFDTAYRAFAAPGAWELYTETQEVLDLLRQRKYRLAVLSNFDRRLHGIMDGLGIAGYFEHILVSSQIGADKPHPWIFEAAAATLDLPPSDILHIGDEKQADEQGPLGAGFQAAWLDRKHMTLWDAVRQAGCAT